ncbi:hypothetical protein ABFB09_08975 [Dehalogenimonas sp. THU2]|uniref:hypothetical protein n=1 Tax=Dehalogenimonas sp. THU2 TaxID=3151121 RepID=UPI00321875B7
MQVLDDEDEVIRYLAQEFAEHGSQRRRTGAGKARGRQTATGEGVAYDLCQTFVKADRIAITVGQGVPAHRCFQLPRKIGKQRGLTVTGRGFDQLEVITQVGVQLI